MGKRKLTGKFDMQTPKTGFLCGCLGRRSRAPKGRFEDNKEPTTTISELNLKAREIPSQIPQISTSTKSIASRTCTIQQIEKEPLSAAFNFACLCLSEKERMELKRGEGLKALYKQLDCVNTKSREESPFRRGVQKLFPTLQVVTGSSGLVSPLAALDPITNTAFGIVQSVMTIAVGICGAEEKFQEAIQAMLSSIPIIERCDEIWDSKRSSESLMFQVLVRIYKDFLDFYFEAIEILKNGSFFIGLQKAQFRQRLPEIVSSFTENTEQLRQLIALEGYALIQKIDEDQSSIKFRLLLNAGSQSKQTEYYNSFQCRANDACTWIVSTRDFREWLKESDGRKPNSTSNFCILFGNMGSGKSVTTSFVKDFLIGHTAHSVLWKPFVCVYYCKNDNESNKARNIYRSILWQILSRMGQLRTVFDKWYQDAQEKNSLIDPTSDDNAVRDFLVHLFHKFSRRLYLVLDGIDECDHSNRNHIFGFFEAIHKHGAPVSVFLSSRTDDYICNNLPSSSKRLWMKTSKGRDKIIATFHVNERLRGYSNEMEDLIVEVLAQKAQGSAIWLEMVVKYLSYRQRGEREMKRDLQNIPPPKSLSELYRKLFENATHNDSDSTARVESALEILAISERLLTLDELAYAVTLRMWQQDVSSLLDLEDFVNSAGLLGLIHSFVSIDTAGSATVRLVHQSLKDLILREPPTEWGLRDKTSPQNMELRKSQLHSNLLTSCMKYLLLPDLQDKNLFPEENLKVMQETADDLNFLDNFHMDVDDGPADGPETQQGFTHTQGHIRAFDPELLGFGKFFTYAACHWIEHLKQCSPDALPDITDVSKLARPGSLILQNWMETYKRPNLTTAVQRDLNVEDFDELMVAAHFGSHAFLAKFLEQGTDDNNVREKSCLTAVTWAMESGDLTVVRILLQNKTTASRLRNGQFLCGVMSTWKEQTSANESIKGSWKQILDILVREFCSDNVLAYEWANTILCSAAKQGCLPGIELLFEKASGDAKFSTAVLKDTEGSAYQSVGAAAFYGQEHVIQYLLTQHHVDISPHLNHHTPPYDSSAGRNVLHCAANSGNGNIFRTLIEKLPTGVNELSKSGETPLSELIFACPSGMLQALQVLLEVGNADVNLSPNGEYFSPLRTAIRAKNAEVCRLLAIHGACVDDAMEIDASSGRLKLKDSLEDAKMSETIMRELAKWSQSEICRRYLGTLEE